MTEQNRTPADTFSDLLRFQAPKALAWVRGQDAYSPLSGLVKFYTTPYEGVLVEAEFFNLPKDPYPGYGSFFAMHIHENGDCSQSFRRVGAHYNPTGMSHPYHGGDLLPLMANDGYAWSSFYDKRFSIDEILGRSVVLHSQADDFTSQPSGSPGIPIGCGRIEKAAPLSFSQTAGK